MSKIVHVVSVDTRNTCTADISRYNETTCNYEHWKKNILDNPKIVKIPSPISKKCGMDIIMYVAKFQRGFNWYYRQYGPSGVASAIVKNDAILSSNNGAATYLNIDVETGLADWIVCGKAYVVCNDGEYPLSKGQVWGLIELVNCSMDIFDLNDINLKQGKESLDKWAKEYKLKTWLPPSGTGKVAIYESK